MSSLDHVVPQATQVLLLNRIVEMVVLGEESPTWLQHKLGFNNLRNVWYYLEAARWARFVDENEIRPTSLGRRYVSSRFDPCVLLEGVRGRAFFEEVMRVTGDRMPTPVVVETVLRRWSFRYSRGTVTRRASDFCRLFGRIIEDAANQKEPRLVIRTAWVEPEDVLANDRVPTVWPQLYLTPTKGLRCPNTRTDACGSGAQLPLPLVENA